MSDFKVVPEFRDFITQLTGDEQDKLRTSILAEGCRDPLVVWDEENILIDGHNRFAICTDAQIPYATTRLKFPNADHVKLWMYKNQVGRRNLNQFQLAEMTLKMKPVVEAMAKERMQAGRPKDPKENFPDDITDAANTKGQTRDKLGEMAGMSGRTIDKVSQILSKATPEVIAKARADEISISGALKTLAPAKPKAKPTTDMEPPRTESPSGQKAKTGIGINCAHAAIAELKKITPNDPERGHARQIITGFLSTWK